MGTFNIHSEDTGTEDGEHHPEKLMLLSSPDRDNNKELKNALKMGFDRVLKEPLNITQCVNELIQLTWEEADKHGLQCQNTVLTFTLDRSKELILLTDSLHSIQYVNKAYCQVLGYQQSDLIKQSLPQFHQLGNMDQVISQLEKGNDWMGKISWRCKSGDNITLQCRAVPFTTVGCEPVHYLYIQENPQDTSYASRGSVPSVRKGSYDVKSINSEGTQSARRLSVAKLSNLPLETPVTKIITLINAAQENSSVQVQQILDKVLDMMRTTELHSAHIKSETLKCDDPVTSDLIGALVTGPAPASSGVRRSSNDSGVRSLPGKPSSFNLYTSPQLKELLDSALLWDFDIFKVEELSGKRPLVYIGMNLLLHFDCYKILNCDERTLYNWLTVVERNYHSKNSYHNSSHAADVMQATASFLEKERVKRLVDEVDEVCCLIAAACHDIDHPGKSSAFLCNLLDELAVLYNDITVLESHHAALTFKLTLKDDRINIFKGLERDIFKAARQSIVDMILATEMTKHFEHLTKFVSVFNKPVVSDENAGAEFSKSPSDTNEFEITQDDVILVKRMMIKCADVSNPTRTVNTCVEWARRIALEYFNQTDEEKAKNLPVVMPMFDRQSCSIPKSQMGFIDFIINDMFEAWDMFIDMPELLYNLRNNYQFWKDLEEKGITSLDKMSSQLPQQSATSTTTTTTVTTLPNIPEKGANS